MNKLISNILKNKIYACIAIGSITLVLASIAIIMAILLNAGNKVKDVNNLNSIATSEQSDVMTDSMSSMDSLSSQDESEIANSTTCSSVKSNATSSQGQSSSSNSSPSSSSPSSQTTDKVKNNYVTFAFSDGQQVKATIGLVNSLEAVSASYPTSIAYPETTPVLFKANGSNYVSVTSAWSVLLGYESEKQPTDLFNSNLTFVLSDSKWWLTSDTQWGYAGYRLGKISAPTTEAFNDVSYWNNGQAYWRRCYSGIFDIATAVVNGKEYVFTVNHGENKNEKFSDGRKYANTIQPRPAGGTYADNQYSGVNASGTYDDYANGYFAFTSMSVAPAEDIQNGVRLDDAKYDKGPILWPSNGYLDQNNNRANAGMRHPSLLIENNYLYVYYVDGESIRVARSPVSSLGDPSSFKIYSNGNFSIFSLPNGFDKNSRDFFKTGTGNSTQILRGSKSLRFSVSKIKGTDYYLGVEEYFTAWPAGGIRLRISKDLVNWSDGYILPGFSWNDYNKGSLHYPMLYNNDLTEKSSIDATGFYIVGQYGNNIGKARRIDKKLVLRFSRIHSAPDIRGVVIHLPRYLVAGQILNNERFLYDYPSYQTEHRLYFGCYAHTC